MKSNTTRALRADPTRTTLLRDAFARAMRTRIAVVKRAVSEAMAADLFALAPKKIAPITGRSLTGAKITLNYIFRTDADKLKEFDAWLREQIAKGLLSIPKEGYNPEQPWMSTYIDSAYRRGLVNAYNELHKADIANDEAAAKRAVFLEMAFAQPERMDKVRFLATRAYNDLRGVSDDMARRMNRVMATAIANGYGPGKTAKLLREAIDGMPSRRAELIARTEIIAAHAQGQLDAFKDLGVKELGVMAEWSTAGDDRVCEKCAALQGRLFTIEEAQGMIPVHALCRCSWIPAVPTALDLKQRGAKAG